MTIFNYNKPRIVLLLTITGLLLLNIAANENYEQVNFDFTFTITDCNKVDFFITQGTPVAAQWDFGDGNTSTSFTPTHYYGTTGSYNVCLTASDGVSTFTVCKTIDIFAANCCSATAVSIQESDKCCFDVTIDNPVDQFFTGLRFNQIGGAQFQPAVSFNAALWGLPLAPTSTSVEFGYIGAPHIPVGNGQSVFTFCLTQATAAPEDVEIEWLIGPNTICKDTVAIECELCMPDANTFSTVIEVKENPMDTFGYDERGMDIIADKNTDELFIAGRTEFLDEIGSNSNLFFQKLDECGEPLQSPLISGQPILGSVYDIKNVRLLDVRSQGLTFGGPGGTPIAFAAVCTVTKGNNEDFVIVLLDIDGVQLFAFEELNLTPEQESIEQIHLFGTNNWIIVGTRRSPTFPFDSKIFVTRLAVNPPFSANPRIYRSFEINQSANFLRSTGFEIAFNPTTQLLYVVGQSPLQQLAVVEMDLNLVVQQVLTIDVDNDPNSTETGKSVKFAPNGDLVIWGDIITSGGPFSNSRLFMTTVELPISSSGTTINNNIYNLPGGDELVEEFIVDNEGLFVVGGDAKIGITSSGTPPPTRPFLMRVGQNGTVLWAKTYNEAHHLEGITETSEGYAMVGTHVKFGGFDNLGMPITTDDTWVAQTNTKGELAECNCFEEMMVTPSPTTPAEFYPAWTTTNIPEVGAAIDFTSQEVDNIQNYCSPPCATGGPGNPCPDSCCSYISGFKFMDKGVCDGVQSPFEPNICGWTIELVDASNVVVATTTTNSAGLYTFANVCPGTYTVREVQQSCWIQTAPAGGTHTVVATGTSSHFGLDFGNCPDIDCHTDLNGTLTNLSQTPNCTHTFSIDNNLCLDLSRVVVSTTNGVSFTNTTPKPGYQFCALYPPTSNQVCIEAAGGGPIPSGNGLDLLDFDLINICSYQQIPQDIVVQYFLELPCSQETEICTDTLIADCPINCPGICDGVEASYTADTTLGDCCFDIMLTNPRPDLFTQVNITTLGAVDMTNQVVIDPNWFPSIINANQVSLVYGSGNQCPGSGLRFLPTGTSTPLSLCLDNFTTTPQLLEVEWLACSGEVCKDTLEFNCEPPPFGCVKITNDTFYCEDDIYKYIFDWTSCWDKDIKSAIVNYIDPATGTVIPQPLTYNPAVPPMGQDTDTLCFSNLGNASHLEFQIQFFEDSCCWCFSDTIKLDIPECPCDCDDITYLPMFTGSDTTCCWTLDIDTLCFDSTKAIELNTLGGVSFLSVNSGPGWLMQTLGNTTTRWFPAPPPPGTTVIGPGPITNQIHFCLDDYQSPLINPQLVEVNWIDMQDSIFCQDTLAFDCDYEPDTCLVIVGDTIICLPDGSYEYQWSIFNKSAFNVTNVLVNTSYTNPLGGTISPPGSNPGSYSFPQFIGSMQTVQMPPVNISSVSPGDQFCIYPSIYDTQYNPPFGNFCCLGDTSCVTIPPCPPDTMTAGCCDSLWIYGDVNDNRPTKIKHFNGYTYIASTKTIGNDSYAVFSKFDGVGNLQWEIQLDTFSQILDFERTPANEFLLVGRSMPVISGGAWQDNHSILARVDDFGSVIFVRAYPNYGRETFTKIIRHPNPPIAAFPYYIKAVENQDNTANSSFDESHLYNLDGNGTINWGVEYTYTSPSNNVGTDDQWVGLAPLQNGNLVILGDYAPGFFNGILIEVSGLDGSPVFTFQTDVDMRLSDALQLPSGLLVVVGAYNIPNFDGAILLIDPINWTVLDAIRYPNQEIGLIREVDLDTNGDLFAVGQRPNGLPVMLKYQVTGGTITEIDSKYFIDGETAFTSPTIFTDPGLNRLYYADARTDHPYMYGDYDILHGSFDLSLTDTCLEFIALPQVFSPVMLTPATTVDVAYTLPTPLMYFDIIDPGYMHMYVCPDTPMVCCADSLGFINAVDNGFVINQSGLVVTVDNPLLDSCYQVSIDWGDGQFDQLPAFNLPFTHTYTTSGNYTICILVQEINDDGTLCWERQYCDMLVGTATINLEQSVSIMPNPTFGTLMVEWDQVLSIEQIRVRDHWGRAVLENRIDPGVKMTTLELSELPPGLYFIELQTTENQTIWKKVVKQ